MSQRAYALRRGVSNVSVHRAIKAGRLKASLTEDGKILDPDLADREWDANTDSTKVSLAEKARKSTAAAVAPVEPPPGEPVAVLGASLSENNAAKVYWQARQAELKFKREAGELVPASDVRMELESVFRACRTRLLGIPTRAVAELPELGTAGALKLENLIREALEGLASSGVKEAGT
jgi:hypothetical protein